MLGACSIGDGVHRMAKVRQGIVAKTLASIALVCNLGVNSSLKLSVYVVVCRSFGIRNRLTMRPVSHCVHERTVRGLIAGSPAVDPVARSYQD